MPAAPLSLTGANGTNNTNTIAAPSGTNGCSGQTGSNTTGTFVVSTTPATAAANINTAVNSCNTTNEAVGVTSTVASNVVTVTDTTLGSAPTLTLGGSANNGTTFTWSAVTAGTDPTYTAADLIFFSVLGGTLSGCTDAGNSGVDGCVLSFDVTNHSAVALSGNGLNVIAGLTASRTTPTGGLIIDNSVGSGTLAGASQIYFMTTYNAGTCTTAARGFAPYSPHKTAP